MQVNFGSFSEIGGKKVITGIASHLNSEEIIKAMVKGDEISIKNVEDEINTDNNKVKAYNKLENLLSEFSDVLRSFAMDGYNSDIFQSKQITLQSNNNFNGSNYLNLTNLRNAQTGEFNISDIILATSQIMQVEGFGSDNSSIVSSTPIPGYFTAGIFELNGVNITLNVGDTLLNIMTKINDASSDTHVHASILKLSSNNYQLFIISDDTGDENAFIYNDPDNIFFSSANLIWQTIDANDASFSFNNNTIKRSSNKISDLLTGIEINLTQNTQPGTNILVKVEDDKEIILNQIKTFVDAYNNLLIFYEQMNQRDPITNKYLESSPLGGDSTLNNIIQSIKYIIISKVYGLDPNEKFQFLSDIGIDSAKYGERKKVTVENINYNPESSESQTNKRYSTFDVGWFLKVDEKKLKDALNTNLENVRKLFVLNYSSTNKDFAVIKANVNPAVDNFDVSLTNTDTMVKLTTLKVSSPNAQVVAATPTVGKFTQGTIKINNIDLQLNNGDTLTDVVDNINNLVPNVLASIEQDGNSNNFNLLLKPKNNAPSFTIIDIDEIFLIKDVSLSYILIQNAATITYQKNGSSYTTYATTTSFGSGFTITANQDTDIEGLKISYYKHNPDSANINITQGFGYMLNKFIINTLGANGNGVISKAINEVNRETDKAQQEIAELKDSLKEKSERLLKRFADLEASVAKINSYLKYFDNYDTALKASAK